MKFSLNESQADANLGIIMENNNIIAAIVERLKQLDQVEFAIPDSIDTLYDNAD